MAFGTRLRYSKDPPKSAQNRLSKFCFGASPVFIRVRRPKNAQSQPEWTILGGSAAGAAAICNAAGSLKRILKLRAAKASPDLGAYARQPAIWRGRGRGKVGSGKVEKVKLSWKHWPICGGDVGSWGPVGADLGLCWAIARRIPLLKCAGAGAGGSFLLARAPPCWWSGSADFVEATCHVQVILRPSRVATGQCRQEKPCAVPVFDSTYMETHGAEWLLWMRSKDEGL